jgi:hypothetical protein
VTVAEIAINALILVVLALAVMQLMASRAFRSKSLQLAARLRSCPVTQDVTARLPPAVRAFALKSGAVPGSGARSASFTQTAEFRLRPGGPMVPLSAWQVAALGGPGFLWEARIDAGSFRQMRVIDGLVDGEGVLEARLMGSIPLARASGSDVTLGEAMRYLAELPWMPDAILGNPSLHWRMTGPETAEVSAESSGGTATVTFRFDAAGDITAMEATGRPARDAAGKPVRLDWRGTYGDYAQIGPRRVPATAEVGYVHPSGYEAYFRGRIADYLVAS